MFKKYPGYHKKILKSLDFHILRFASDGSVLAVSPSLLRHLAIRNERSLIQSLISKKFISDLSKKKIFRDSNKFSAYRSTLKNPENPKKDEMYTVCGFIDEDGSIVTAWQSLPAEATGFNEGSLIDAMQVQEIIRPYVPSLVLMKAVEAVEQGYNKLPSEEIEASIFFADLVGFTQKSERMVMSQVVDMLNIAFSIIVRTIEKNQGNVDKFIGDAVMAIFNEPLGAIIAAVEIQNQFYQLNELREMTDQEPIHLRIGIHTGKVILSSVGVKGRMDWTALGDVVNTASRIERTSSLDSVLISEDTYQFAKDQVEVQYQTEIKVKGKADYLLVYYVKAVEVKVGDKIRKLSLKKKNIDEEYQQKTQGIDFETNLSNKKEFETLVIQFLKLAQRKQSHFLLLLIDIANIGQIEENCGLTLRKQAIRLAAKLIRAVFRGSDIIGRIGESLFAVIAVDTEINYLPVLIKRLQVENGNLNQSGNEFELDLSIGVSEQKSSEARSYTTILEEAFKQMKENPVKVF